MRTCKIKPTYFQCGSWLDWQVQNSVITLCDQCEAANIIHDLMFMTDDYAVVMDETGALHRVEVDRIYDIKEEDI